MIKLSTLLNTSGIIDVLGKVEGLENLEVSTDSRRLSGKNTFIALYGDNFDGFKFVENLLDDANLNVFIFENKNNRMEKLATKKKDDQVLIAVENIYSFILELAKNSIKDFKNRGGRVIGLTGSNGKTTNKEMLAYLLSYGLGEEKVHFTKGNLNNHIGVPLTVFDIEDPHEVAIIEMGTNHPGEIKILCDAALPDYGMITNIGHAHIEYLKNLDGVLEEKSSLYKAIENSKHPDKVFVLNGRDEKLRTLKKENWVQVIDEDNSNINDDVIILELDGEKRRIDNPSLLGTHQQMNMAMCFTLSSLIYPKLSDQFLEAANNFKLKGMNRGEIREFENFKVYLDAYNANPSSMVASLRSFKALLSQAGIEENKSLLILGDMNEIGDMARELHKKTAQEARNLGFKHFAFVGRYKDFYSEGVSDAELFEDASQLKTSWKELTLDKEFIFIKGSRSLQLESILDIYKD